MASRRTRIKGIANIPQRRKVGDAESAQSEEPKSEDIKPEIVPKTPEPQPEDTSVQNNVKSIEIVETLPTNDNSSNKDCQDNVKIQAPVRRKFIKPAVSLSSVKKTRKVPEINTTCSSESDGDTKAAKVSTINDRDDKKIVILNEIITHPDKETKIIDHDIDSSKKVHFEVQINSNRNDDPARRLPICLNTNLEAEYPIPPPSPNKINRSRIKAVPRLGQRHASFSASESEDESRRNYNRHRNDSVCSTTSLQDQPATPTECPSPQKPTTNKEYNMVIQRKCRRTEQSRKLAEARRDFYQKFGNNKPDRQKLTMIDLIFYNPTTNTMSSSPSATPPQQGEEVDDPLELPQPAAEDKDEEAEEEEAEKSGDEENEVPAPQIKIGPQGEIILDEKSLVIESKKVKKGREEIEKSQLVNSTFDTGYGIYKRAKRSKDWSREETLKFYKALNTIGTDFALMCDLFPLRTRRELKMKFKKEERINHALVDKAILQSRAFNFDEFKHEVEMEELEMREVQRQREKELAERREKSLKKRKREEVLPTDQPQKTETPQNDPDLPPTTVKKKKIVRKRKKPLDIMNILDSSSNEEISTDSEREEEGPTEYFLKRMQKPTRYGRVPKIKGQYNKPIVLRNQSCNDDTQVTEKEEENSKIDTAGKPPGSLMIVASTGPNGEPIYNVYMVTGDNLDEKQKVGGNISSLSEALDYQKRETGKLKNIMTLTARVVREQSPPVVENNITIPAEENVVTAAESL